jgi:hypothetical protein
VGGRREREKRERNWEALSPCRPAAISSTPFVQEVKEMEMESFRKPWSYNEECEGVWGNHEE